MRFKSLIMGFMLAGCGTPVVQPIPSGDVRTTCRAIEAEALLSCTQPAAHPRAGCFKFAHRGFADCLSSAGQTEDAVIEVCRAECLFLAITCNDQAAAMHSGFDCHGEQDGCDASCFDAMERD